MLGEKKKTQCVICFYCSNYRTQYVANTIDTTSDNVFIQFNTGPSFISVDTDASQSMCKYIYLSTSSFVLIGDRGTLLFRVYYVWTQKSAATTVGTSYFGSKADEGNREGREWKEAVSLSYWTATNDCPEAKRSWRQSDWLQRRASMTPEIWAVFNQCLLKKNNTMYHLLKTRREKHLCLNARRIRCVKRRIYRMLNILK